MISKVILFSARADPGVATFGCFWPGQKRKGTGPNARARARTGEEGLLDEEQ